jgi:hypothetical protein
MPKKPKISKRIFFALVLLVVVLSGLLFGSSMRSRPAMYAVVTGNAIPCIGPVEPATTAWKGLVTLTRNGVVVAKQQVTDGHFAYVLRAAPGTYFLTLKGIGGWRKVVHLDAGQQLRIPKDPDCL